MAKQLTVHNATINTAAVEVKTLTISGKQVTLAVFRQLREEQLIADDGTLNGVPWGYVNYHPDKCDQPGHRHYVWQRGDELLRSRVESEISFEGQLFTPPEATRYLASQVQEWMRGRLEQCPIDEEQVQRLRPAASRSREIVSVGSRFGVPVLAWAAAPLGRAIRAKENADAATGHLANMMETGLQFGQPLTPERVAKQQAKIAAAVAELEAVRSEFDAEMSRHGMTHGHFTEAVNAVAKAESLRRERHGTVRAELAQLPQLFIAV